MADTACPSCGNVNPLGTEKCLKCGTALPRSQRTVTCPNCQNVNAIGSIQCAKCGAELPMTYLQPTMVDQKVEKQALGTLKLTAIVLLLGGLMIYIFPIVSWAYYGYMFPSGITTLPPPSSILLPPVPQSLYETLLAIAMVGVVLFLVGWFLFARAFGLFARVDRSFSIASVSAFIGIISAALAGGAIALNLDSVYNYINCGATAACLVNLNNVQYTVYWLWAFSILFLIFGGIGVLIGLFRVGARYLTGTFWISGFLLIFPILLLIGAILLLVAATGAEKRLESWEKTPEPDKPPVAAAT